MKSNDIKARREALGLTQVELAGAVSRRSGRSFSQQSLQKLEAKPDGSSRYMHYILDILEERESGERGELLKIARTLPEEKLLDAVEILKALSRGKAS